jgi:hypothetical protein
VAVDLARTLGSELLRGDYYHLVLAGLCEPEQIDAASDDQILKCHGRSPQKVQLVRDASKRVAQVRAQGVSPVVPVLEEYVA